MHAAIFLLWCGRAVSRGEITLASADAAGCGWWHGGGGGGGIGFAVKGLKEGSQAVTLGIDKIGALGAGEGGWDEAAGLQVGGLGIAGCGTGVGGLLHSFAQHGEEIGGASGGKAGAGGRHVEAVEEGGRV